MRLVYVVIAGVLVAALLVLVFKLRGESIESQAQVEGEIRRSIGEPSAESDELLVINDPQDAADETGNAGSIDTSVVVSKVVDSAQITGMDDWLQRDFVPSQNGREIANVSILEIDTSAFLLPQSDTKFILTLAEDKELNMEMTSWKPSQYGGGSWVGSAGTPRDRVTLHIDNVGNLRGTIMLPGEAWAITATTLPPYHVSYQLIDSTFLVD